MVSQYHCKIFHETQNPPYSTKNKYSLVNCPTIVCTKKHVLYLSPGVWFLYPMELLNNYLPSQLHQPGKKKSTIDRVHNSGLLHRRNLEAGRIFPYGVEIYRESAQIF
jgi:hypothetical protein